MTGFFNKPTRVRVAVEQPSTRVRVVTEPEKKPARVRVTKALPLEFRQPITPKQKERVHVAILEMARINPRSLKDLSDPSTKIVHGEITGYTSDHILKYGNKDPAGIAQDMLWMVNHSSHMYWTQVMLAGALAIKQLLEEKE